MDAQPQLKQFFVVEEFVEYAMHTSNNKGHVTIVISFITKKVSSNGRGWYEIGSGEASGD